jgi:AraC family transcriptional regulator
MTLHLGSGRFFGEPVAHRSTANLAVVQTRYAQGAALPVHAHERPYLMAVLHGGFSERCRGREHECTAGTLVLNLCAADHSDRFFAQETSVLNIELEAPWVAVLQEQRSVPDGPRHVDGSILLERMRALEVELQGADPLSPLLIDGLAAELIGFAARAHEPRGTQPSRPWLAAIEHALRERFRAPPSLLELGRLARVSPTHVARAFRAQHGCSIGTFVRRLRVASARVAIANNRASLAQIASDAGFADQSHMTREFRVFLGTSPARLRP